MFYAALFAILFLSVGAKEFDSFDELNDVEPDEIPTFEEYLETDYLFCNQDQFRCSDGKCISLDRVCNGESDCRNGDDEGGFCSGCDDYGCGAKCQNYPTGPRCICPAHMFLSVDGRTCEFEERCVVGGQHNCSQHCKQVQNYVSCFCAGGYSLVNGYDCGLNSEHRVAHLFIVSNDSSVHRFSLFGNASEPSLVFVPKTGTIRRISSVAFNRANDMLYFVADEGHRHMKLYVSNGVEMRSLFFGFAIKHVVADWVANNIYYAADGLGIGVCKSDGRYCRHLITASQPTSDHHVEKFADLIVHPARGILIWLHYSLEHPNGVIMAAGMDGRKSRILTQLTTSYVTSLSIDYVMDRVYFIEAGKLYFLDLHTLLKHSVSHLRPPSSMIVFDDHLFYVSKFTAPLFYNRFNLLTKYNKKTSKEEPIFEETLVGVHFPMAINNSIYYANISNPCTDLDCSHMCVLSEIGIDKVPRAVCICPDKYRMDEGSNVCVLYADVEGPVRTSVANMEAMCADGTACYNGGSCPDDLNKSGDITPFCDCPSGFNGLYCEIRLPGMVDNASSVLMILFLLFVFVLIAVSFAVIALKLYPNMRQKFESFSNVSVTPTSIERMRRAAGPSLRQRDNVTAPMLSRSPSANFSSTTLLRTGEELTRPIHISNSFSNPSFATSNAPSDQQRLEQEQIEREIQIHSIP